MKNVFSSLILLLFLLSCSPKINYIDGHKIIRYGTKEFEEFEKNAPIKKEEAWKIYFDKESRKQLYTVEWILFVIDDNYIITGAVNPKKMESYLIGSTVNSKTGELKGINKYVMIKYENAFTLNRDKPFPHPVKRKYRKKTP